MCHRECGLGDGRVSYISFEVNKYEMLVLFIEITCILTA